MTDVSALCAGGGCWGITQGVGLTHHHWRIPRTGLYVTWRCEKTGDDCCRVGPSHRCFCGHAYSQHAFASRTSRRGLPRCQQCACKAFDLVPSRPEEVGEWWLPRRTGVTGSLRCVLGAGMVGEWERRHVSGSLRCLGGWDGGIVGEKTCDRLPSVCFGGWDGGIVGEKICERLPSVCFKGLG